MITEKQYREQKTKTWFYLVAFLISLIINCIQWYALEPKKDICIRDIEATIREYKQHAR
jgi:hypothetical protein